MSDFTNESRMLQESVRRYVERSYSFAQRSAALAEPGGYADAHWQAFAECGWLSLGLPQDAGGLGTPLDQAVLAEELGRALVAEPWLANAALCGPLVAGCGWAQAAQDMGEGRRMLALAAWEAQGRYDAFDVMTTARQVADGWVLNGRKTLVLGASSAHQLLVLARSDGQRRDTAGLSLLAVAADAPGVRIDALPTYDGMQTATVTLHDVVVAGDALIGAAHTAWPHVEAAIDHATVMACAQAVGTMARALELTQAYVSTRKQFGRAISANQVVRHRIVDMYIGVEQSRAITEAAATALTGHAQQRRRAVSLAKAFVSEAGRALGEDAVQLHGAIGMTNETEVGHCYKRLAAHANFLGDVDWHLARLAAAGDAAAA